MLELIDDHSQWSAFLPPYSCCATCSLGVVKHMQQASSVSMVNCRKHWLYNHSMCSLPLWSGKISFTQHKHICIWSSSLSVFHLHCPALMSVAALRVLVQQLFNPSPLNIWTSSHIPHRLLLTSCELYMWLVLRVIYESCWNCFLNTGIAGSFQYQAGPVTKICNVQSYHCTLLVKLKKKQKHFLQQNPVCTGTACY